MRGAVCYTSESRIEEENNRLLSKESEDIPVGRKEIPKKKKEISNEVRKKKFTFKKGGKLTAKENSEIKRTHKNLFDWINKEKTKIEEKDRFENVEEMEVDSRMMEKEETLEKEERLNRMKMRMMTWESRLMAKYVVDGVLDGLEGYRLEKQMAEVLEEVLENVQAIGDINIIVRDIENKGIEFRNIVEESLARKRMEE